MARLRRLAASMATMPWLSVPSQTSPGRTSLIVTTCCTCNGGWPGSATSSACASLASFSMTKPPCCSVPTQSRPAASCISACRFGLAALHRQDKGAETAGTDRPAEQATLGTHPQGTLAVLQDRGDAAAGRIGAGGGQQAAHHAGFGVQGIQAALAGNPETAMAVLGNRAHADMGQAIGTDGIADEAVGRRFIAGQTETVGTHPQAALAVAMKDLNIAVRQGTGTLAVGLIDAEAVTVPAGQPPQRANPEVARTILCHGGGDLIGQAVVLAQMAKTQLGELRPALGRLRGPSGRRLRVNPNTQQQGEAQHSAGRQRAQPGLEQGRGGSWVLHGGGL